MYYIQNKNAGYLGNAIMFWALNSNGYTADLNRAEKFNYEDAKRICQGNPKKNIAWPVSYIDNCEAIQKIVDVQYLNNREIQKF